MDMNLNLVQFLTDDQKESTTKVIFDRMISLIQSGEFDSDLRNLLKDELHSVFEDGYITDELDYSAIYQALSDKFVSLIGS